MAPQGRADASPVTSTAPTDLRTALQAFDHKDLGAAEKAIRSTLDDPSFANLDEVTRHVALALGAQVMLENGKPETARQLALQASQMPQEDVDDWRRRLSADTKLGDVRDEAECVAEIYRQWGANSQVLPDETVFSVFNRSNRSELSDIRLRMLEVLHERRWQPSSGQTASRLWCELTRLLIEKDQIPRAAEVASLIDAPEDIVAMQADNQFKPVRHSSFVKSNPRRQAGERIKQLQGLVAQNPRSLRLLWLLLNAEVNHRMEAEVLAQTDAVDRRVEQGGGGSAAYDDYDANYNWVLDARARALRHQARYEEAVAVLRRAIQLTNRRDKTSQPLNLAGLLCELDRPEEALALLPPPETAGDYGRMVIQLIRLSAAVELDRPDDASQALAYLKEHRADSPIIYQHALVRAHDMEAAEQWLLARLSDPVQRVPALLEMQRYVEPPRPARDRQWHELTSELTARPAVQAAVSRLGRIETQDWRYNTYD